MELTIGCLYPDLFNLYGDGGNVRCLEKRLEWRGIDAKVISFRAGDRVDFGKLDILAWGGGSDRGQELSLEHLRKIQKDFRAYVEDGGVLLAVCAAYQLLGRYYRTGDKMMNGLGILDIHTEWEQARLVGNIILESPFFKTPVVGFENHAGRTYIGKHTPLGKVLFGNGNTENGDYEGVIYRNVIATYLHGPLLPKNPEICDWLLRRALERKYGADTALAELPDAQEIQANRNIVERYKRRKP